MVYVRKRRYRRGRRALGRKRYGKKKYSISIAKLKSKRVDSLLESRIVELSKKVVVESKTTYVVRGIWTRDGTWPQADIWCPLANSHGITETQFVANQFGRVGGYLNNDLSVEMSIGNDPANPTENPAQPYNFREMYLRLKMIKFQFRFLNVSTDSAEVDICLWRTPMRKRLIALSANAPSAQEANQPDLYWHRPFTFLNSISSQCSKKYRDQAANLIPNNHQLIVHRRFTIDPNKMIDNPAAGGGDRINMIKWKEVTLVKYFKGLGKREKYELVLNTISPDAANLRGQLSDCRYYFSMRASGTLAWHAVSVVSFQRGKNTPRQVVFDEVAHQAL